MPWLWSVLLCVTVFIKLFLWVISMGYGVFWVYDFFYIGSFLYVLPEPLCSYDILLAHYTKRVVVINSILYRTIPWYVASSSFFLFSQTPKNNDCIFETHFIVGDNKIITSVVLK